MLSGFAARPCGALAAALARSTALASLVSCGCVLAEAATAEDRVEDYGSGITVVVDWSYDTVTVGQYSGPSYFTINPWMPGTTASLTTTTTIVGQYAGSTGSVNVIGPGASWHTQDLYLAYGGSGALTAEGGGLFTASTAYLAGLGGSVATATVTGAGSTFDVSGALFVGERGSATLNVTNGGHVEADVANIGMYTENDIAGTGVVTVSGATSTFDAATDLFIGRSGNGTLLLTELGTATVAGGAGTATIAENAGSVGTLVFGALEGEALAAAGTIDVTTVEFGLGAGRVVFNHTGTLAFAPSFVGDGVVDQLSGITNLTGDSATFIGDTTVRGGTLLVNGSLGGTVSITGGRLGGGGHLSDVIVASGGTLAPGNSIGTLTVATATFEAGSTYEVEIDTLGNSDLLDVTGAATLDGGNVVLLPGPGVYDPLTQYTILSAGTLTGEFDGVIEDFAFLTPHLDYVGNDVILTLDASFNGSGETPNQVATGEGLDTLGVGAPYYNELIGLGNAAGPDALDQLSGEGFASVNSAQIEDSRYLRQAALGQLDRPLDTGNSYWSHFYAGLTSLAGDNNAAGTDSLTGGLIAGVDATIGEGWRGGGLVAAGHSSIESRNTSADSTDLSLGVYAGGAFGAVDLKLGAAYTHHLVDTTRTIAFGAVDDELRANYSANTAQAFVEISSDFDVEGTIITPFGSLAAISQSSEAFEETGGDGALSVEARTTNALIANLGLGASRRHELGDGSTVTVSARAGWRHAFADQPISANSFAGGAAFDVGGTPITENALALDIGVAIDLASGVSIGGTYSGQYSEAITSNAFKLSLSGAF